MVDAFLFVGLPYLAIVTAVVATVWRWRNGRYSLTARSSQFLEDRSLLWGAAPWHIGIILVLAGHGAAFLFPTIWSALLTVPGAVLVVESVGVGASLMALAGLGLLIARRITNSRVQAVTTTSDLVVVALLVGQLLLGVMSAVHFRHGSVWATGTVVPYFWGLFTLQPDMTYVTGFPMLFKLHVVGAWILLLLLPFTRLMHLLAVPLGYLWRAPQLVVWNTARRRRHAVAAARSIESRREFIKGALGVAGAGGLMSIGVSEKTLNFFKGPRPDPAAETALLQKKLERLQLTAEERAYELERQRSDAILVSRYADLTEAKGRYFIDYAMAPGLAFKDKDGLPLVLSAKCTHLGCTVGSDVDAQGRILCPCHISYFDVRTGQPNAGAPAKSRLPEIAWALIDGAGKVVLSRRPGQPVQGKADPATLAQCNLYITRPGTGPVAQA